MKLPRGTVLGLAFERNVQVALGDGVGVAVEGTRVGVGDAAVAVDVAVGGTAVAVDVAVGGTAVAVDVAVGGTGVAVGVAVGGTGVAVDVAVGAAPDNCGPRSLLPRANAAAAFQSVAILSPVFSGLMLQFQPPA